MPESARLKDALVAYQNTNLLVYSEGGPKNWADFWNIKEFPGPRLAASSSIADLAFALVAMALRTRASGD